MGTPLDPWLSQEPSSNPAARQRALEAARAELALQRPVRPWRLQALGLFAVSVALTACVAGVLLGAGRTSGAQLAVHAPVLGLLWACGAVCAWGALAPRGRGLVGGGVALAVGTAAVLVLARGAGDGETVLPSWVCTAGHVALGLVPLGVAGVMLRAAAFRPSRALLAGLSAGTTGAFVGELACTQDWRHVLLYHLPAWALVALATLVLSRWLTPRSFAP